MKNRINSAKREIQIQILYKKDEENGWINLKKEKHKKFEKKHIRRVINENNNTQKWSEWLNINLLGTFVILREIGIENKSDDSRGKYDEIHFCKVHNILKNDNGECCIVLMSYTYYSDMHEDRKNYLNELQFDRINNNNIMIHMPLWKNDNNLIPLMFVRHIFKSNEPEMISNTGIDFALKVWNINKQFKSIPKECKWGLTCDSIKPGHYSNYIHPYKQ